MAVIFTVHFIQDNYIFLQQGMIAGPNFVPYFCDPHYTEIIFLNDVTSAFSVQLKPYLADK